MPDELSRISDDDADLILGIGAPDRVDEVDHAASADALLVDKAASKGAKLLARLANVHNAALAGVEVLRRKDRDMWKVRRRADRQARCFEA